MKMKLLMENWRRVIKEGQEWSDPVDFIEALGLNPVNENSIEVILAGVLHQLIMNKKAVAFVTHESYASSQKFIELKPQLLETISAQIEEASLFVDNLPTNLENRFVVSHGVVRIHDLKIPNVSHRPAPLIVTKVFESPKGLGPIVNNYLRERKRYLAQKTKLLEKYEGEMERATAGGAENDFRTTMLNRWIKELRGDIMMYTEMIEGAEDVYQQLKRAK